MNSLWNFVLCFLINLVSSFSLLFVTIFFQLHQKIFFPFFFSNRLEDKKYSHDLNFEKAYLFDTFWYEKGIWNRIGFIKLLKRPFYIFAKIIRFLFWKNSKFFGIDDFIVKNPNWVLFNLMKLFSFVTIFTCFLLFLLYFLKESNKWTNVSLQLKIFTCQSLHKKQMSTISHFLSPIINSFWE